MKAWVVREWGDPDSMVFEDVPEGDPPADMLRIKIEAAAINFFDSLMIAGTYQTKPDFPFTPGGEVGGTVAYAPEDSGFASGDRVSAGFAVNRVLHGGYAEYADTLPMLARKHPDPISFEDPAPFYTAHQTGASARHPPRPPH